MPTCPTDTELRQFNEGGIDDPDEIDRISAHLADCTRCLEALDSLAPGLIAKGLQDSFSIHSNLDDTGQQDHSIDLDSLRDSVSNAVNRISSGHAPEVDFQQLGENRFEIIASVGDGEFGRVFGALTMPQAASPKSNPGERTPDNPVHMVGIKIPYPHKLTSYRHCQQFFDDCQRATTLNHPNIQRVIEYGHWDEKRLYLSKSFLQHPTLTRFARRSSRLNHESMITIFRQLVDAVHHAHGLNVIHRHLTPDNIHIIVPQSTTSDLTEPIPSSTRVVISDFGFVLDSRYHFDLVEPASRRTPFISPESATLNAGFVDVRTDIFSLGKILKLLVRITDNVQHRSSLQKIIDKSSCVRRRDRYQTVSELKSALNLI